ncbi:uncharacterized protein [Aristolochia californica]|uniref:uncharacterized protein n=1 Tax=Aristolochia californica TaxID=171875 RepID=UPI0035DF73EB
MNLCDRICNQSTINYSRGKYNRRPPKRQLSSADARSPGNQSRGKESTKEWAVRSFYSYKCPERNSVSAIANANHSAANSGKNSQDNKNTNSYRGKPAVFFEQSVIDSQAEKFKFCLVGKFLGWRPSLSKIREWVTKKWKLNGQWSITLLDHCHVFITLDNEADMIHVWARNRWFIGDHPMKVFKWFPAFVPANGEPSSAAVWASFPSLPVVFFQEELLFPVASLAGKVLATDDPTRNRTRTNVARVCVEVDLLKDLPRQVWVGVGEGGFWQDIHYEKLPPFCTHCRQQGHSAKVCQANRSNSQAKAANLKPRTKTSNIQIKEDRSSQETCSSRSEQVRISKGTEAENGSKPEKGKGAVKCKAESISKGSPPLTIDGCTYEEPGKDKGKEAIEHRADSSYASTGEQILLLEEANRVGSGGAASGKPGSLPRIGGKNVDLDKELHQNSSGSKFGEKGESLNQVARASPPRRRTFSSRPPIFFWKNKQKDFQVVGTIPGNLRLPPLTKFEYSEIKNMTKSFRDMVGEGGHGTVFKGKLRDGQKVAVKIGKQRAHDREFFNEMQIIKTLGHKNIVRLLGYCYEGSKRALVYEFMPNGSLDGIIYPKESRSSSSQQSKKLLEIAIGIARGLEYLQHECDPPILHFDIKPRNILLDRILCPKIADFGLAHKLDSFDSGSVTSLRGTVGYVAPELRSSGSFSRRTDVYSYGIMLLEMAFRRKPVDFCPVNPDEKFLIHWIRRKPTRWGGISSFEWEETERRMIIVGLWCTQSDPANRPLFSTVVDMLEGKSDELCIPPGYSLDLCVDPSSLTGEDADNGNVDFAAVDSFTDSSLVGR